MRRMQWNSLFVVCVLVVPVAAQSVYYVDENATGSGSGADWCNANTGEFGGHTP